MVIQSRIFPQAFKNVKSNSNIISCSREILGHYRSTALLSNLSKILEKLTKTGFDKFFSKNKVLYADQYGCKKQLQR